MTPAHFLERLRTNDLSFLSFATRMPAATFQDTLRQFARELHWTYRARDRGLTAVIPVAQEDGAAGYVVVKRDPKVYGHNIDYLDDAVGFAPEIDRVALAVGLTLAYDYSDHVDLRQHTALIALCRGVLHAPESEREWATMTLLDFLVEYNYAPDGE